METIKQELILHQYRILYQKPPISYRQLAIDLPEYFECISKRQQFQYHYENLIQRTQTDLMAIRLMALEESLYDYEKTLDQQKIALFATSDGSKIQEQQCKSFYQIIDQRLQLMHKKFQIKLQFHLSYYIRSHLDLLENMHRGNIDKTRSIPFANHLIIDSNITHQLTKDQLALLNRGPTYVPPCQLQCLASSYLSQHTLLTEQYQSLVTTLTDLGTQYSIDIEKVNELQQKVHDEFLMAFSTLIPPRICHRASYEQHLIQVIQHMLKSNELVLRRTADHNSLFYLTTKASFEEKCHEFIRKNNDQFELVCSAINDNCVNIHLELDKLRNYLNQTLNNLFQRKYISQNVYDHLCVTSDEIKLGYLYFLPDLAFQTTDEFDVKPMFSMMHSLTWKLAEFLEQLLRPTLMTLFKSTTVHNDSDFIQKLYRYCTLDGHLHSGTLFVRIKIKNFSTMYTYQSIIDRVGYVLTSHLSNHPIQNISIVTIERLIELYLKCNIFYYEGNIYRLTHGLPECMRLNDLLLHIASYPWQQTMMNADQLKKQFIVRHRDELFFTWNRSEEDLRTFLQPIREKYDDIHMDIVCNRYIHYLHVFIENCFGHLYTCVYRPAESHSKLILPYVTGQPLVKHKQWFRTALIRAIQLCSNYDDFNQERIYMEMACLTYGYSVNIIENEVKNFYNYFDIAPHQVHLNTLLYQQLRTRLLNDLERQCKLLDTNLELERSATRNHLYYMYDYGHYKQFEENFLKIWSSYTRNHTKEGSIGTKLRLNGKHLFSLNTLLTEQRPMCTLLD
ncbi:unnamed protein product [Rotaria sp. Silwood1]|nr:unnamed protein product [Rotaria sp. Silwood1]CAF1623366.1 unnamed protein product [Rotaria sp. Silwood1]